jgi:hypothetical protein
VKKTKLPGDNISLKTKKTEDPAVMQWINAQTNLMDSLRYLIENEIVANGVRNLQAYVPAERNVLNAAQSATHADAGGARAAGSGLREPAKQPEPVQAAEDEIDDEDIQSWI